MGKAVSVYDENRTLKKRNEEQRKEIERLKKKLDELKNQNKQIGLW